MDAEMHNMKTIKVWSLVLAPPKEVKVVGCCWVYNLKKNNEGKAVRYKARLVAQGFSQRKFQSNPGVVHWSSLMKLLGYLQATRNYKLDIRNIAEISLTAYSDADFASCIDDRISVGGHVVFCGNAPVSWRTAKQKSVTLSSMEAEFLSICETAKELMWLKNVLEECQSINVIR
ncbi:Retrovirus-related Pol polyprotein from transposon RE2 [Araneus ventricosus]|uniref:Retrovirus-related Pol polyprotein from transposon RE2 n=1 Tax=Araneus ventricosus TaxID=182803 RepID=A0A4Y2AMA9_ARAVE|nr:Retrovirus-related Pol polyprotein from transposon RE2 [Araneus ventricosus]